MKIGIFFFWLIVSIDVFSQEHVIDIYKMKFVPAQVTIEEGDTVIWRNVEKRQYHSVWFKQLQKEEPDYFFPDESYQRSFEKSGEFSYECGPHPRMKGTIIVIDKVH